MERKETFLTSGKIDLETAYLDPGSVFSGPEELLEHKQLTKEQKIEILQRWEYDASENCVALEEGMPDGESDLLRRILLTLQQLTGGANLGPLSPTKQHGIPRPTDKKE